MLKSSFLSIFGMGLLFLNFLHLTFDNIKSTKKLHLVSFLLSLLTSSCLLKSPEGVFYHVSSSYASSSSSPSSSTGRSLQKISSDSRSQIRSTTERKIKMRHNQVAPQPNPYEQTLICPTAMIKWAHYSFLRMKILERLSKMMILVCHTSRCQKWYIVMFLFHIYLEIRANVYKSSQLSSL